jgi:hypothetical protein
MSDEYEESTLEWEGRQRFAPLLPLVKRGIVALESIAESLETIAGCVGTGYTGAPAITTMADQIDRG